MLAKKAQNQLSPQVKTKNVNLKAKKNQKQKVINTWFFKWDRVMMKCKISY